MDVIVVVPTYNERENLALLAPKVLQTTGVRLLVVDDGSPDGTADVARALAREYPGRVDLLQRARKEGLGRAYVAGFVHALAQSPDYVCQMDADGSHDPADLLRLIGAAQQTDLAIGSRYVRGGALVNWPLSRRLLSRAANLYVRSVLSLSIADTTAGYRCWRPDVLRALDLESLAAAGYAFQVETLHRTVALGFQVVEIPITFVERRQGVSKMDRGVILESMRLPWTLRARRARPAGASPLRPVPTASERL